MKDENQEHPSPEVLVDLVEGVAVDAIWTRHVSCCSICAKEVESLRTTLDMVSATKVPEPDKEYWDSFDTRLKDRIARVPKKHLNRWAWAAAAAAVIAAGFWTASDRTVVEPYPVAWRELVLPPAEDDDEYQALLSFAEILADTEDWAEAFEDQPHSSFDPSQLTAGQTEELRQKLKRDIEVMDHAKS